MKKPQDEGSVHFFVIIIPGDVTTLYDQVRQQGYLEKTLYGMLEFSLQDPDGHLLSFGQDLDAPSTV
jgi:hypothetical protein